MGSICEDSDGPSVGGKQIICIDATRGEEKCRVRIWCAAITL